MQIYTNIPFNGLILLHIFTSFIYVILPMVISLTDILYQPTSFHSIIKTKLFYWFADKFVTDVNVYWQGCAHSMHAARPLRENGDEFL